MSDLGLERRKHFVVVGLGNPGKEYALTRHNMGYMVVEAVADKVGSSLKKDGDFQAKVGQASYHDVAIHLVMPTTYMNLSGIAVQKVLAYYKVDVKDLLVVVDDAAIPFGVMRLREAGSSGGHNGLKSIQQCLGTQEYPRLRMGIGAQGYGTLTDHVLGDFSSEERKALPAFIEEGATAVLALCDEDIIRVMQQVNTSNNKETPRVTGQENLS